jgi:hypothetical protein
VVSARPTFILGLSAYYHDSAACLLRDGEVVAAAQEERFTRRRHDAAFPAQALAWCLAEAGIAADRIDHVCFYDKPVAKFGRLIETHMATAPRGLRSFLTALPVWLRRKLWTAREIEEALGGGPRVLFTEHHQRPRGERLLPVTLRRGGAAHPRRRERVGHHHGGRGAGSEAPGRVEARDAQHDLAVQSELRDDGAHAPVLGEEEAADLRLLVEGGGHRGAPRRARSGRPAQAPGGASLTPGRAHQDPGRDALAAGARVSPWDTNGDRTEGSWEEGSSADDATSGSMHGGGDGGGTLAEGLGVGERGSVTEVRRARSRSR